jgi:hypothetical protein
VDDVPVLVAQHLHLDVAGVLDVLLEVDPGVAERPLRLGLGDGVLGHQLLLGAQEADADAPAPLHGFEHHRIAEGVRQGAGVVQAAHRLGRAGHDGEPGVAHRLAGEGLLAQVLDRLGAGPDEGYLIGGADLGEAVALGEEARPGVDGVRPGHQGGHHDVGHVQVGAGGRRGADADGLVRQLDVERGAVGLGEDGDRADVQLAAGPDDAHGDLAPVGDEQLGEHFCLLGPSDFGRGTRDFGLA